MLSSNASQELVLLTHGIASTRWFLGPLAYRLRKAGFQTQLHGYPSLWWSNRSHGHKLAEVLRDVAPRYDRVHLVVHSMGSSLAR
jgi:alpha-beta hydrolase superfamily lysophospholipase